MMIIIDSKITKETIGKAVPPRLYLASRTEMIVLFLGLVSHINEHLLADSINWQWSDH